MATMSNIEAQDEAKKTKLIQFQKTAKFGRNSPDQDSKDPLASGEQSDKQLPK